MQLNIISPSAKKTHTVAWLEVNTPKGNFIIQPGHVPTIITLTPNERFTYCLYNGKRESVLVSHGILEVTRTQTTIILDKET